MGKTKKKTSALQKVFGYEKFVTKKAGFSGNFTLMPDCICTLNLQYNSFQSKSALAGRKNQPLQIHFDNF